MKPRPKKLNVMFFGLKMGNGVYLLGCTLRSHILDEVDVWNESCLVNGPYLVRKDFVPLSRSLMAVVTPSFLRMDGLLPMS